ncbi:MULTISPECIES: hypothetical protein [unclassified Acidovorax]|uniref:hypothetical protein n=1 Tax=unclassified Acidovorax TaxID=2684926 RepID=UPI000A85E03F|nr:MULTISPECIES: hypothetical protein [unclassified Acidovorax]
MTALRIAGALLLVAGMAVFVTGGFSIGSDVLQAPLGALELTAQDNYESVVIPQWMSLGAMVLGGMVLVVGFRRKV